MKYAIISDIHANLPALEAVLEDIAKREIDGVYHLGDLVGYGPWPNETVDLLRDSGIRGVSGNYDSTVATGYKHCGCRSESAREEELSHISYEWTRRNVSRESKDFLSALPFRIDTRPFGGHVAGPTLMLFHATPVSNLVYVTEDRPDSFLRKMAAQANARAGDTLCFGHTHKPWHRTVDGIQFVNTGSVGRPKDGDPRTGYAIVDIGDKTQRVHLVRIEYDIERAAAAITQNGLPPEFAEVLRHGQSPKVGVIS